MDHQPISSDSTFFLFALPTLISSQLFTPTQLFFLIAVSLLSVALLTWALSSAGPAWPHNRSRLGPTPIPGIRGLPLLGSLLTLTCSLPHRTLARLSRVSRAHQLLAFSIGSTPTVVSTDVAISKEILTHPNFSDRPIKFSARELMFHRAMGFAPNGVYWRLLRRIASSHLFAPRRIAAHEPSRQLDADLMLYRITSEMSHSGRVTIRPHLQTAALNNVMGSVFGIRYEDVAEADTLKEMVREGFELLGAFNWCDHLPWLSGFFDPGNVKKRCSVLVPRVKQFVQGIIDEHRSRRADGRNIEDGNADFVDVLLNLEGDEKLDDDDIIAVLWEMIFRGTDTTALLTEWALAELILNQDVQIKLYNEIAAAVRPGIEVTDADVAKMPYLQAVIKETLRVHPPGPLLSWARLSTDDVKLSNGMVVPAGTTAMVNMWGITHDEKVWARPEVFDPERFIVADVDVRGCDLRLAPFGAGRRVCPGKNLGLVTVGLWVAKLVRKFKWEETEGGVDLSELLKLSCEMKCPLVARTCVRN